ncbi:glycosyl transferase [Rhodobacterales bacterium HKCCE2091]|nr:glycosyl transferase [Rhodobacterales bacterium HKCCE2091]
MPRSVRSTAADPRALALFVIAALTAWRLAFLPYATADLFVDETQYWQWGQALDWGYYSKPPLIGWVLRAVTDLAGSDSAFWIRMPGAVFHAATTLLIVGAAGEVTGRAEAALCGVVYLTLPLVAVGAFLISTDTILLPFFAAATWLWLKLVQGPSAWRAALLGLCLGLGMMAKYAGIYFALGAAVGALIPQMRIAWRDLAIAVAVLAVVIAPNVVWNLQNDLVTLSHTADNADWVGAGRVSLHPDRALEFLGSQFLVMGPVFFGAYLWAAWRAVRGGDARARWLVAMSAPILLLVTVQALLSRAYANWAVTAFVAATILAVPMLWNRARWLVWTGLALNLAVALALPVITLHADTLTARDGDRLLFRHYVGRTATSERILAEAHAAGAADIVSGHRDLLADLFHTGRDSGFAIFAAPVDGPPPHYYEQVFPYSEGRDGPTLWADFTDPPCDGEEVARWSSGPAYRGADIVAWLVPPDCWSAR